VVFAGSASQFHFLTITCHWQMSVVATSDAIIDDSLRNTWLLVGLIFVVMLSGFH